MSTSTARPADGHVPGDPDEHCELCGSEELLDYATDPDGRLLLVCAPCAAKVAPRAELVGQWFDSDLPSQRTRALELWQYPDGSTELVTATRETASDVWPVSVLVTRDVDRASADAAAAVLGLDPYLVRGARSAEAAGHSVRVAS